MEPGEKKTGHYLGTEINGKWWRRYSRDGLLARGIGEFWCDDTAIFFRRHLTKDPIVISFSDFTDIKVGKWHSGRWSPAPILKITWKKDDTSLCSGFVLSSDRNKTDELVQMFLSHMKNTE